MSRLHSTNIQSADSQVAASRPYQQGAIYFSLYQKFLIESLLSQPGQTGMRRTTANKRAYGDEGVFSQDSLDRVAETSSGSAMAQHTDCPIAERTLVSGNMIRYRLFIDYMV